MKKILLILLTVFAFSFLSASENSKPDPIRLLVITGNHNYNKETFNAMFESLGGSITYQVVEFPLAFEMFLPENRDKYDVLVFYHMWQKITEEQKKVLSECIRLGKPVVVLHHSICAFDDWPEYWNIIGGKYFHKLTALNGKEYQPCSFIPDIHFRANIVDTKDPVTKGVSDFDLFDEAYKGYYVAPDVKKLITTSNTTSSPIIG
jgi:uncharacterized protein